MTAILFDSTRKSKSRKSRPFATGLQPGSNPPAFEPTAIDREWVAQQCADRYAWATTELNHIEKTASKVGDRLEATRAAIRNVERILDDELD